MHEYHSFDLMDHLIPQVIAMKFIKLPHSQAIINNLQMDFDYQFLMLLNSLNNFYAGLSHILSFLTFNLHIIFIMVSDENLIYIYHIPLYYLLLFLFNYVELEILFSYCDLMLELLFSFILLF